MTISETPGLRLLLRHYKDPLLEEYGDDWESTVSFVSDRLQYQFGCPLSVLWRVRNGELSQMAEIELALITARLLGE